MLPQDLVEMVLHGMKPKLAVAQALYKPENVHTRHTGEKVDIDRLIRMSGHLEATPVHIRSLRGVSRSPRDGFSPDRYQAADERYPILYDAQKAILDGRHRALRRLDAGYEQIMGRLVPENIVKTALVPKPEEKKKAAEKSKKKRKKG